MEPYPHPYVLDTDGELQLVNPTIDAVFGGMIATLGRIKSCTIRHIDDIYGKKNLNLICDHVHDFEPVKALRYLNNALQDINDIKALGDKVVSNVKKEYTGMDDDEGKLVAVDLNPGVTDEELKTTGKLFIDDLIKTSEVVLKRLRATIIRNHPELIEETTPKQDDKDLSKSKVGTGEVERPKPLSELLSFKYKHWNESQSKITDLKKKLIKHGLIDPDTTLPDFKKVFSGAKIESPIKWTGDINELNYFIKLIHSKYEKVDRTTLWKTADLCFVQPNGEHFGSDKLKWQHPPKKSAPMLERWAKNL